MVVGYALIRLRLFSPRSLKDKRMIIKGLIGKIRSKFNVSIAEIGENDMWNLSEIGLASISNEGSVINGTFNEVIKLIDEDVRVEIINIDIKLL